MQQSLFHKVVWLRVIWHPAHRFFDEIHPTCHGVERDVPIIHLFSFTQLLVLEHASDVSARGLVDLPMRFLACFAAVASKFAGVAVLHVRVHSRSVLAVEAYKAPAKFSQFPHRTLKQQ